MEFYYKVVTGKLSYVNVPKTSEASIGNCSRQHCKLGPKEVRLHIIQNTKEDVMKKEKTTISMLMLLSVVLGFSLLFTGCTSNIKHIPKTMNKVEKSRVYNGSFDQVWGAALRALSEGETFKIFEKTGGIMVTEFRTVDSKELSLVNTYFFGKTYKSSYTLNFIKIDNNKTEIKIYIKLKSNQLVLVNREESNENVANYLRINLFNKIAKSLKT